MPTVHHTRSITQMMQMNGNVICLFKKSKASLVQRDDMKHLRSEDDEKHKEHTKARQDNCKFVGTVGRC